MNGQKYQVGRAFGCMVDSFKISGGDGILEGEVSVKAYGLFETAKLITNESVEGTAKTITGITWANGIATVTSTAHGLAVNNLINVASVSPA